MSGSSDPCRTSANTTTEAVPNEILNNCDMATKLVPKEIEYYHRMRSEYLRISLLKTSHRNRARGLPGALLYRATD